MVRISITMKGTNEWRHRRFRGGGMMPGMSGERFGYQLSWCYGLRNMENGICNTIDQGIPRSFR